MSMPKITIITITYNSEKTLERTIRSIVDQDYGNLEYIIVDGASTDGTIDIIRRYEDRIARWISEPDDGISDAFNKGIRMATGDVIGIINSDDGLMPGALRTVADAYDGKTDVYRGKVLLWKEDTGTKAVERPSMHFSYYGHVKVSHQSTFISRSAYEKYGLYGTKYRYAMDYDLLMRMERAGAVFRYIDSVLAFYTLGGLTFTAFTPARRKELEEIKRSNGANGFDIAIYRIVSGVKRSVKKIIRKDALLKLFNQRADI